VDLTTEVVHISVLCHPRHLSTAVPALQEFVVLPTTDPVPMVGFVLVFMTRVDACDMAQNKKSSDLRVQIEKQVST